MVAIGVTYSDLMGTDITTIFGFLSNSDVLVLLDSSLVDRESTNEIRFSVVATDSLMQNATANVTITVTDANDETPNVTNGG